MAMIKSPTTEGKKMRSSSSTIQIAFETFNFLQLGVCVDILGVYSIRQSRNGYNRKVKKINI